MDIKQTCKQITVLCQRPNTALQAIHQVLLMGSATSAALMAIYNRAMTDSDLDAAYYLTVFAQKTADLPFDVVPLVQMIMQSDDELLKQALRDKLPAESAIIN